MKIYVFALLVVTAVVLAFPIKGEKQEENEDSIRYLEFVKKLNDTWPCRDRYRIHDDYCHIKCQIDGGIQVGMCENGNCTCYILRYGQFPNNY